MPSAPPPEDAHRAVDAAEQAAAMMTAAGMPRMPSRVMMALVAAPDGGYTAAQLADRLGVSAAAVSGAVRYLQQVHFVQRRTRPGDRRDRYELAHDGFYGSVAANMPLYEKLAEHIDVIAGEHDEDAAAARARELAEYFRFLSSRMLGIVQEWRDQHRE